MLQLKRNRSAFTLIELLVVVIIVAVLAAVGVPLLSANVQRARTSEADAGLGTVRTGLRSYFAENNTYTGATIGPNIGIATADLNGRYFATADYGLAIPGPVGQAYCISATGSAGSTAPRGADVAGVTRSMNSDGTIFNSATCL